MRSQNDLDVGGGSAAVVDQGAGDGGRAIGGGLRLQRTGGEPGKAEAQQYPGHVQVQPAPDKGHSGSLGDDVGGAQSEAECLGRRRLQPDHQSFTVLARRDGQRNLNAFVPVVGDPQVVGVGTQLQSELAGVHA